MTAVFTHARCTVCARKLTVHQDAAGDICDDARCRHQQIRLNLQVKSQQSANVLAKLTEMRNRAARNAGMDHQPAPLAALPSNDRSLGELPVKRHELFRQYLEDSVSKAVASRNATDAYSDKSANRSESGPSDAELAVMGNGCATCRGSCCEAGGEHAFLNPADVRKKLDGKPGISPTDLVATYLSKLPAITFVGSCVFHTKNGCALEREDRSETCNNFYCAGISDLWHGLSCGGSLRGFVGAVAEERVMRFALIDEHGSVNLSNY